MRARELSGNARSARATPEVGAAARRVRSAGGRTDTRPAPGRGDVLERFVYLLDARFRVPVLGLRFGIDPILGLIPGVGDLAGSLLGLAVLTQARREGARWTTLSRMATNLLIDFALGLIPIVGDVADAYFKANLRNLRLLEGDRARRGEGR